MSIYEKTASGSESAILNASYACSNPQASYRSQPHYSYRVSTGVLSLTAVCFIMACTFFELMYLLYASSTASGFMLFLLRSMHIFSSSTRRTSIISFLPIFKNFYTDLTRLVETWDSIMNPSKLSYSKSRTLAPISLSSVVTT